MLGIIQKEKKYAYILGDFNVNTLNELTGLSLDSQTFVGIVDIVGICYGPPQVCAQKFIQELHFLLERLHKMNKVVYLLGDFNINTKCILWTFCLK